MFSYGRNCTHLFLFVLLTIQLVFSSGPVAAQDGIPIPADIVWGEDIGETTQLYFDENRHAKDISLPVFVVTQGTGCYALVIVTETHHVGGIQSQIRGAREHGPLTSWRLTNPYLEAKGIPGLQAGCQRTRPIFSRLVLMDENAIWYFIDNKGVTKSQFDAKVAEVSARWPDVASPLAPAEKPEPHDRLDLSGDPVSQFVAYAAALGIEESDITAAIVSGRFVPHPDDVAMVLALLDPVECAKTLGRFGKSVANDYQSLLGYDCPYHMARNTSEAHAIWNDRFGPVPDDRALLTVQRTFVVFTGNMTEPTWVDEPDLARIDAPLAMSLLADVQADYALPFHIIWEANLGSRLNLKGQYGAARKQYLAGLDTTVLAGLNLVADDATYLGERDIPASRYLTPFYHGNFKQLDRMRQTDPNGSVRYADQMAVWAFVRLATIGDCGDPLTTLIHTVTPYTKRYENGQLMDITQQDSTETLIEVLAAFADPIIAVPETVDTRSDRLARFAERLGCDSPVLQAIEANMVAYFFGQPPAFQSGL